MSKHEFRDEDGNIVDPNEVASGGYEVVDEIDTNDEPAPKRKGRRAVAVSAAVIALLAGGGGAAYVLTAGHDGASALVAVTPSSSASSVAPSSSTPSSSPSSSTPGAANGVNSVPLPLVACTGGVDDARWEAGAPRPSAALKVVDSVELPPGFTGRTSAQLGDALHRVQILQTGPAGLGVYWDQRDSGFGPSWWKVSVETGSGRPVVAGEGAGTGGDRDFAGACTSSFGSGTYLVTGRGIPGGAQADQPGQIELSALKVDSSSLKEDAPQVVWVVARNQLLKTELVRVGSSSSVSTTPATGGGER